MLVAQPAGLLPVQGIETCFGMKSPVSIISIFFFHPAQITSFYIRNYIKPSIVKSMPGCKSMQNRTPPPVVDRLDMGTAIYQSASSLALAAANSSSVSTTDSGSLANISGSASCSAGAAYSSGGGVPHLLYRQLPRDDCRRAYRSCSYPSAPHSSSSSRHINLLFFSLV